MSRLKQKLQDNLSLSSKLFLKELIASSKRLSRNVLAVPGRFAQRAVNRLDRAGMNVPRALKSYDTSPPELAPADLEAIGRITPKFPPGPNPKIKTSIVIPVFNKANFTFQCLRSLCEEIDFNQTEIIVVDNASTDNTQSFLEKFQELVRTVWNEENRGFVDACNQGAAMAKGAYLVFLNNDTKVLPGWLTHLIETIEKDSSVGAVGSLFLYPDNSIQEAGAIVWRNGEAHHYGWGESPDDRRLIFAREVDYCSAASLLIRKDIFDQLGGFDRRFAPAYYEDVDLCFGVRSLGYKVIYQPMSRVIHYEGVTAGRDVATGVKHFQVLNRERFVDKWREVLARDHLEKDLKRVEEASRPRGLPAVVVFDERIPTPDRDAGSARMFMILQALSQWSSVVFASFNKAPGIEYEQALWKEGIETSDIAEYRRLLKRRGFHAAVVSRPSVAEALIPRIQRIDENVKLVFDMVDAHFIRLEREHQITGEAELAKSAQSYRDLETKLARASDVVWCNSSEDKRVMDQIVPGKKIVVIPTIHDLHGAGKSFEERRDLLFVGNLAHRPNSDSIHYLMREIFPLVSEALPDVTLHIVGDNADEMQKYASERVRVTGYLPDITSYWETCRVFLAPLRFGAGVKGKIGEAMSYGLPVVTTEVGAEGFGLTHEIDVMIANDPISFAHAVARLYSDKSPWETIARNSRKHIGANFTPQMIAETINESIR